MSAGVIHISYGGPNRVLFVGGRKWLFEDHPYCGPIVLGRNGEILDNQPAESSPFWSAVSLWYQQGKRVSESAGGPPLCEWDKPTIQKMRHIGGRNYELVP